MGKGLDILYFILLFQNLDFKLKNLIVCVYCHIIKKQKKIYIYKLEI